MPGAKKLTPQQQRDRRAKMMLAGLSVVLVAVMAFELPSLIGGKKKSAAAPPATTTTAAAGQTASTSSSSVNLASLQVTAAAQPSQLKSFGHFATKDPFRAPAGLTPKASSNPSSGTSGGGGGTTPPAKLPTVPTTVPSVTFATPPATAQSTELQGPMVLGAVLLLNGVRRVVPVGSQFPVANPIFKLVAVGRKVMWISLIGGSFGDGQQKLKVTFGHPIKLVNTTAGLDYVLRLMKLTTVPKPTKPATMATAPTTATSTSTTSTTTSTTTTSGP